MFRTRFSKCTIVMACSFGLFVADRCQAQTTPRRVVIQNNFNVPICLLITQVNTGSVPVAFKVEESPEVNQGDSALITITPGGPSASLYIFTSLDSAGFTPTDTETRSLSGVSAVKVTVQANGQLSFTFTYAKTTEQSRETESSPDERNQTDSANE